MYNEVIRTKTKTSGEHNNPKASIEFLCTAKDYLKSTALSRICAHGPTAFETGVVFPKSTIGHNFVILNEPSLESIVSLFQHCSAFTKDTRYPFTHIPRSGHGNSGPCPQNPIGSQCSSMHEIFC